MKRIIAIILSIFIFVSALSISGFALNNHQNEIQEQKNRMASAHAMAEAARALGYNEDHNVILLAKEEWTKALKKVKEYHALEKEWENKRAEYPEATYIWEYLKSCGYSDYVCAGILGNIMVEVGGHTLAIQPYLTSYGYTGMCQWSVRFYPGARGLSLAEQCVFLTNTIKEEFSQFGYMYYSGFNYNSFINMTDCQAAALAFAKVYERCSSGSYSLRQSCAVTAYNYFVN